jgi:hypothetical protein
MGSLNIERTLASVRFHAARNARHEHDLEAWWLEHGLIAPEPDDDPHGVGCRAALPMDEHEFERMHRTAPWTPQRSS